MLAWLVAVAVTLVANVCVFAYFRAIESQREKLDFFRTKQAHGKSENTDTRYQCCNGDGHKPRQHLLVDTTHRLVYR